MTTIRSVCLVLLLTIAGCGPSLGPSAGLAPAGVDPGASGGFSDAGSFGWGPYGGDFGGLDGF